VYVADVLAITSWAIAPPSDHDANSYEPCGDGALIELRDPSITVLVNGV